MFNYNSPGAITIYVFIGVGIVGIFSALLYTKVIKKNRFGYCNKSIFTIKKIVDNLKLDLADVKPIIIKDLFLNINNPKDNSLVFYYLSAVIITDRFCAIITYELNKQNFTILNQADKIITYTKKDHELLLPVEIQTVIEARKATSSITQPLPLYLIIPWDTKKTESISNSRPNVYVVPTHKISNFLKTIYEQSSQTFDIDLMKIKKEFVSKNYQKRLRLPFLNWNVKDTVWDKRQIS